MIGKLITWGENRFKCLERMQTVLRESVIFGVHTNIEFLKEILAHSEFVDGTMTTGFIAEYFPNALGKQEWTPEEIELAQKLYRTARMSKQELQDADQNPWNVLWRNV
jgi:3-methylcrotonyl-CoA carboxylase alpha subunit